MGGPEDFGVCTGGLIRLLDLPLPRSRRLLGAATATNLGQKPKLGGVRALLTFPLYYPFYFCFDLFEAFPRFSFFLSFQKHKKISFFSLVCFVFRVQLESVMAFDNISHVRSCK